MDRGKLIGAIAAGGVLIVASRIRKRAEQTQPGGGEAPHDEYVEPWGVVGKVIGKATDVIVKLYPPVPGPYTSGGRDRSW